MFKNTTLNNNGTFQLRFRFIFQEEGMYCCNCGKELEEAARFCSVCGTARPPVRPPTGEFHPRTPLCRIREGKKLAGVCGGVARYFDLDVTLVRILWILMALFPPLPGIIAYFVCWIAMPQDPPAVLSSRPAANASSIVGV
jgi:phage shock protein C